MNKKLTLSLDQKIIEQAKEYARERQVSLSFLIENYFSRLVAEQKTSSNQKISITDALSGIISLDVDFDHKSMLKNHLLEKYK
jgi:uncharacterized protein (UPF0262 family)